MAGAEKLESTASIVETAPFGCAAELAVLIPITACPCPLTASEGIQSETALPEESKIVPERESVGVDARFASSYQRTPSRLDEPVAAPVESTPMFCAV